ncbi:hypothetical protein ACO0M4_28320 [Streptomyces sp. RGM 3693]|uniref:hypothetical protein n=1 Tax=Streptomyces sp. RGM 3693 TaxID=3413284 RepID=UPI003D2D728C
MLDAAQPVAQFGDEERGAAVGRVDAATAPDASSQDTPCSEDAESTMSKRAAALVGAPGMNARKAGWSQEATVGSRSSA